MDNPHSRETVYDLGRRIPDVADLHFVHGTTLKKERGGYSLP